MADVNIIFLKFCKFGRLKPTNIAKNRISQSILNVVHDVFFGHPVLGEVASFRLDNHLDKNLFETSNKERKNPLG